LIDYDQDLSHIFECFSKLYNLRKLRIEVHQLTGGLNLPNPNNRTNDLGKVLGANLNLTHFELLQDYRSGVNFSTIFGQVPASSPLKLEHFGIRDTISYKDLRAIIPHIRSLTSIHLACSFSLQNSELIRLLHSERIFPPIIRITSIDEPMDLIHYLNDHPGIISLSIGHAWFLDPTRRWILLKSIARHAKSLKYFSTEFLTFSLGNCNALDELLSQCTKLEQLVLSPFRSEYSVMDAVSEQSQTHSRAEHTPVDRSFANDCPFIKLTDTGDHRTESIQRLCHALLSVTESSDP
jgi:hypothetical protein